MIIMQKPRSLPSIELPEKCVQKVQFTKVFFQKMRGDDLEECNDFKPLSLFISYRNLYEPYFCRSNYKIVIGKISIVSWRWPIA